MTFVPQRLPNELVERCQLNQLSLHDKADIAHWLTELQDHQCPATTTIIDAEEEHRCWRARGHEGSHLVNLGMGYTHTWEEDEAPISHPVGTIDPNIICVCGHRHDALNNCTVCHTCVYSPVSRCKAESEDGKFRCTRRAGHEGHHENSYETPRIAWFLFPVGDEPRPLTAIHRDVLMIVDQKLDFMHLSELVADLTMHVSQMRDRIDEAGVPQLEQG